MIIFLLSGVALLGICIFVHELGHYLLGRAVGIKAKIFSIGYGKGIWSKKIGDTTWQITAIPLGGYVKFYGDDILAQDKKIPNGFFSVGPWTRMIPVIGGPLFNLILAFLLYLLINTVYGSLVPKIYLDENYPGENSPAQQAGLINGDIVMKINDRPVTRFEDIQRTVALSEGSVLEFLIDRNNKMLLLPVQPEITANFLYRIGIRSPGDSELRVNISQMSILKHYLSSLISKTNPPITIRAKEWLNNGDIIKKVNGKMITSAQQLKSELDTMNNKDTVQLEVERSLLPWFFSWPRERVKVEIPMLSAYVISIENLIDNEYGLSVKNIKLFSGDLIHQRALSYLQIDDIEGVSFSKLHEKYQKKSAPLQMQINNHVYRGTIHSEKISLLGFRPSQYIDEEYTSLSVTDIFLKSINEVILQIKLYGVVFGKMFEGKISFFDNAAGPVKIFGIAGQVIQTSFSVYLQLFAAISIALSIINLLPFPILDGGHLLFFLIEGVTRKPIPKRILSAVMRYSFLFLLTLGLYILYKDFIWVFSL